MHLRPTLRTSFAGITLALLSAVTLAQTADTTAATPRVDARQAAQQHRIEQGQASGTLTPRETRRLQARQQRIARTEAAAKADGTVTAQERAHLKHQQKKASRKIHQQKHDAQAVPADR